jgi:O-antigen ligase
LEALLLIAAAVGFVATAVYALRGSLPLGCLLVIVAGAVFGHAFARLSLGPLPLTTDRLGLVLLVGVYVLRRRFGATDPKPLAGVDWALAGLLATLSASVFTHPFEVGLAEVPPPVWLLVTAYVMPAAIYWIARQSPWSQAQVEAIDRGLLLWGAYLGFTAVCEVLGRWEFVFPGYIADPGVGLHFGRARGPLVHAVTLGFVLSVCFAVVLAAWPRATRFGRVWLLALGALLAAAQYFTYTRSVWIGAAVVVLLLVGLTAAREWRPWFVAGLTAASLLVLAVKWDTLLEFKRDRDLSSRQTAESARLRPVMAYVSWKMFLDRPLLGCGLGRYIVDKDAYLWDRTTEMRLEEARPYGPHNQFLALLTETGLLGVGLYLAVLGGWAVGAWRLWRSAAPDWARRQGLVTLAALGAYVASAMFHDMSFSATTHMLLFFLAGSSEALRPLAINQGDREEEPARGAVAVSEPALEPCG